MRECFENQHDHGGKAGRGLLSKDVSSDLDSSSDSSSSSDISNLRGERAGIMPNGRWIK